MRARGRERERGRMRARGRERERGRMRARGRERERGRMRARGREREGEGELGGRKVEAHLGASMLSSRNECSTAVPMVTWVTGVSASSGVMNQETEGVGLPSAWQCSLATPPSTTSVRATGWCRKNGALRPSVGRAMLTSMLIKR